MYSDIDTQMVAWETMQIRVTVMVKVTYGKIFSEVSTCTCIPDYRVTMMSRVTVMVKITYGKTSSEISYMVRSP